MQKYWGIHYNLQFRCFYGKKICDISLIKWKTTLDIKEIYKVGKKKLLVFLCVHVQSVFSDRNQCLCNKYSLYKDLVEGNHLNIILILSLPSFFLKRSSFISSSWIYYWYIVTSVWTFLCEMFILYKIRLLVKWKFFFECLFGIERSLTVEFSCSPILHWWLHWI